jgi:hypothetical protein
MPSPDGRKYCAFNFGLTAAGPLKEWLCLHELLDAGIRPNLLLLEIMTPLLNDPGVGRVSEESWLAISRLSAWEITQLSRYHSRPGWLWRTWARSRVVPGYTHRLPLLNQIAPRWTPELPGSTLLMSMDWWGGEHFGIEACAPDWAERLTDTQVRSLRHAYDDFRIGAGPRRALMDLLDRCRSERIPVAMVLMPEGTAFRQLYTPQVESTLSDFLAELRHTYGARLIDARDWIADSGFYDSHHL